jgi:putative hydrolase of the HAD superfamily
VRYRGVIFDLWQTLVPFSVESANEMYGRLVEAWGADPVAFNELWHRRRLERETGPMEPHLRSIAAELQLTGDLDTVMRVRRDWTFEALVPRREALPTLEELRRRGHKLGMISACSQDVPDVWDRTPLSDLFDSAIFSCSVGFSKPDRRIYELCADELGVEPADCVFVGDGANDELPGAERAGMSALQLRAPGERLTAEGERWTGRYVSLLSDVLELA